MESSHLDRDEHRRWLEEIIGSHPAQADSFRAGKTQISGFFIGRAMQLSGGKADPKLLGELLPSLLSSSSAPENGGRPE